MHYVTFEAILIQFNLISMRRILTLLIIAVLLGSVCCRRRKEQLAEQTETKEEKKTVVEANHFYSNYETSTGYDINSVEKDKPLIFYLKPHNAQANDKTLTENPINITLTTGSSTVTCPFTSYSNLCSLPKVTEKDMKLKIACKKTPCELSWIILQPSTHEEDGDHEIDQLVAVNQQYQHASLKVICNNPDLKQTFASEVKLYSNSRFKKFETKKGMAMFLFSNEQKGYYFITSENEKVRACAKASLTTINSDVDLSAKPSLMDFASPLETNVYEFKKAPSSDFRIEFSAHDAEFKELSNNSGLIVGLAGYKGGEKKQLSQHNLFVDDEKDYIDFSLVYKKPTETYDRFEFELKGIGRLFVVQMHFLEADVQQVQLGEESYFDLKKGEKINYKLVPFAAEIDSAKSDKINIFVDDEKRFRLNQTSCTIKGCDFTLEAIEAGQGNIYIGEGPTRNASQIIVKVFDKNVTQKIREGEQVYFSYKMKADEALQLLINSPSVIAYAAAKDKCEKVDEEKCYEKSFNHHSPAIYEPTADGTLLFKIIALDNCEFTLTVLDSHTPYIELKDTIPFTYLMDDKENYLIFYFKLSKKEDISFNLIAPVNELNLLVLNKEKAEKGDQTKAEVSSDGFIKFAKADIKELMFVVKVEKREEYKNKYIHFTIIASTKEANLRLEPGVAHYETLQTKDSRDYVFQFSPKKNILLNFYTHNIKEDVKLKLVISNADQYSNSDNSGQFFIDREVDVLDLSLVSKKLCKQQEGENCELFVRISNEMAVEADVTITLMMSDAIIELKDGIWQNYAVNMASASSHFYFLPKHQNHSATVFYKSSLVDLKIMYSLWKTDDKSIDPSQWPFPVQFKENEKLSELTFKPIDFIHIDPSQLTTCWPNCVILMSIAPDLKAANDSIKTMNKESLLTAQFKIMASNNYIELPEKHEVDIILVKDEQKELLVDLKYYLEKEALNFYVYTTIGSSKLKANVYSQKNPRCPNNDQDGDFAFSRVQTKLSMEDIKSKLAENSMEDHRNVYLCILAQASTDNKFTIEFSSDSDSIKTLSMDGQATLSSKSNQITYYQIEASQQFELKIARNDGFPYISSKLCKPGKEMSTCIQEFKDNTEKGKQLADKVTEISEAPCGGCLLIVKIDSEEPSNIVLHTQSKYTEVQLIENSLMNDILDAGEQNRYTLTGTKNEEIIINIQIISGNLKVQVHDFEKIDLSKTNAAGSKNIHITIPSKDLVRAKKELGVSHMDSFGLSNFIHLHLTVQSQNPKEKAIYTITYSSGESTVYLEDGLITEYNLVSKKPTKFLYMNPTNTPIYLHLSATDTQALQKLSTKMYAMGSMSDEDSLVELTPEKPDFKKKTPNPTMLLLLPANKFYMIQLTNNNEKDYLFTVGVNNREIIYLPFDHEFPVLLAKTEYIYVVLNPSAAGYIKISFSKCDESEPYVAYTMDYDEFVKEDFAVEEQMSDELIQDLIVKVKTPGGVYFKVRSDDDESSLMTIKATFSPNKISANRPKPGEKGLVKYQLLDSTKAELTFTSLVCSTSEKGCNKDFSYSALSAAKPEDVFAQLVCSSIMIDFPGFQQLKSAEMTPITASPKDNKITFSQPLKGDISYVGIKAINSKTGEVVYYRPVQIVTFWGQLHRTSRWTIILGVILMFVFMGGVLVVYRRWKKRDEYRSLGDMNDAIDRD